MTSLHLNSGGLKYCLGVLEMIIPMVFFFFFLVVNQLHITQNLVFHEHIKNIKVNCHYVCDGIRDDAIATCHISTNEQLVDIFTKASEKQ